MPDALSSDTQSRIRHHAQIYRAEVEQGVFRRPTVADRIRRGVLHMIGAAAVGLLAAGLSVAMVVVVLNLIFHYAPS